MGRTIKLTASDGFSLDAYRADPGGMPKGAIVVVQEIFGVNHHIRSVCDRFVARDYTAVAPALFDRQKPGFEVGYGPDDFRAGMAMVANPDFKAMLRDIQAAVDEVKGAGPVSVVGFCLGGTLAFLASGRLEGLSAAVAYYGGMIAKLAERAPKVPLLMHFGEQDRYIPMSDVDLIRGKRPESEIHVYKDAQHGFNCDDRESYHKPSADAAWTRTLAFIEVAGRRS